MLICTNSPNSKLNFSWASRCLKKYTKSSKKEQCWGQKLAGNPVLKCLSFLKLFGDCTAGPGELLFCGDVTQVAVFQGNVQTDEPCLLLFMVRLSLPLDVLGSLSA